MINEENIKTSSPFFFPHFIFQWRLGESEDSEAVYSPKLTNAYDEARTMVLPGVTTGLQARWLA